MGEQNSSFATKADTATIYGEIENQLSMTPMPSSGFWTLRASPNSNQLSGTIEHEEPFSAFDRRKVKTTVNFMLTLASDANKGTKVVVKYVWHNSEMRNIFNNGLCGPCEKFITTTNKLIEAACKKY